MALSMELINPKNDEVLGMVLIESRKVTHFFGYGEAYASSIDGLNSKSWVKCQIDAFTALNALVKKKQGA